MGIEIERKFLLANDDWRSAAHAVIEMAQGYLNDAEAVTLGRQNTSVRVRLEGDEARLNIKSRGLGASRQEFDYVIPVGRPDAEARAAIWRRYIPAGVLARSTARPWLQRARVSRPPTSNTRRARRPRKRWRVRCARATTRPLVRS